MEDNKSGLSKTDITTATQQTLRRPAQIVKKHSGPLDDVLAEINKTEIAGSIAGTLENESVDQVKSTNKIRQSPIPTRRRATLKDKEKKRERWLLTRKTWRYMTDAGRKLIPDGIQNRQEDVHKIEAHFQKVCAVEPHFVLWRRKYSYPGAMRNSKKRLKQLLQHTGQKSQQALEQIEINNADIVLEMLHNHLKLDEAIKTDTLLGTKTEGPHQTNSPSAQRPKPLTRNLRKIEGMNFSLRGPGFLPVADFQQQQEQLQQSATEQLLQRLLTLSRSTTLMTNTLNIPPPEHINATLLHDKVTLKKIYNALKKQQLHRILSKHSIPSKLRTNLTHSTSMLSLLHFNSSHASSTSTGETTKINPSQMYKTKLPTNVTDGARSTTIISSSVPTPTSLNYDTTTTQQQQQQQEQHYINSTSTSCSATPPTAPQRQRQRKPPTSLNLSGSLDTSSALKKVDHHLRRQTVPEKHVTSCGSQTNFIPLSEIKRLAEEYKEIKREDNAHEIGGNPITDDEGGDRQANIHLSRRKSSIDNEDVSQSVSDTIKRYLRMARKKSLHDDNANRFKRVNYDRNLRNIQAKGEINPPGMDENGNKATQTLDAWALITLDFIRGDINSGLLESAHKDWQKSLDDRLRRKLEYDQKINHQSPTNQPPLGGINPSTSSCSSSAPTSPISNQSSTMANATSASSSSSTNGARTKIDVSTNYTTAVSRYSLGGVGGGENTNHVSSGGIFHSGSQFIANLWQGNTSSSNLSSPTTNDQQLLQKPEQLNDDGSDDALNRVDMKKSKSLSHIGHYVSTKLLKGHTKNQPKLTELLSISPLNNSEVITWSRTGKCSWKSETGDYILLRDTALHVLSELETKMVKEICTERIIELDIGIDLSDLTEGKSHKKHPLTKMRAMTTSFFDIGKKDSNNQNLSLFGNTLEQCVISDKKFEMSNLSGYSSRGSRNSIASLFRSNSRGGQNSKSVLNTDKLNENVRSCENLPIEPEIQFDSAKAANNSDPTLVGSYFENTSKYKNLSRNRSVCRRYSHDNFDDGNLVDAEIFKELKVPKFVKCCIQFLEENGLHKVGIFRVSTSKKKVKQLRDSFHKNTEMSFDENTCPHNVATLLKEFLRDLPEPLLSNRLYKAFLKTQKIRNRRLQLEAISHLVKLLPPAHLDTLYVLLKFLAKVAACSDDICDNVGTLHLTGNKMDSNNLATVFAPNILRSTDNSKSSSGDNVQSNREQDSIDDAINVIRIMIDHYEELFLVSAEILDIVFSYLLESAPEQLNTICEYHKRTMHNFIQFF